ncbi:MAG: hypothetical protein JW709_07830 [Sedimentisphaerales bacterium]|nr:hypothetical protein [Sedimentisphaerales bacterium]
MMTFAILLLIAGLVLIVLEVLLPSGGVISVLATAALVGSIILGFMDSRSTGVTLLIIMAVVVPIMIIIGFNILPHTPIGRKITLRPELTQQAHRSAPTKSIADEDYSRLQGRIGKAVTPLRPSGIGEIDGERVSVVAQGEMIEKDTPIVVLNVEGNNIIVDEITS